MNKWIKQDGTILELNSLKATQDAALSLGWRPLKVEQVQDPEIPKFNNTVKTRKAKQG